MAGRVPDEVRLGREAAKRARDKWGVTGWERLSDDQRDAAIGYEVAMVLLAQHTDNPGVCLLQDMARAAFQVGRA